MKKGIANILKLLAFLIGLPAIAVYAFFKSVPVYEANPTYFPYLLAGLGVLGAIAVIYLIVLFITGIFAKKGMAKGAAVALAVVSAVLMTGVFIGVDKYGAPIVSEMTQGTLSYDDYAQNYAEKAREHAALLSEFIEMNLANGRLDRSNAAKYRTEGYANKDVRELIDSSYASMNEAYEGFSDLLINLATGNRMTIPVVIHLLMDEGQAPTADFKNYQGEGRGEADKDKPIEWTILDFQDGVISFSFDMPALGTDYDELIEMLLPGLFSDGGIVAALMKSVDDGIEDVLGAPIYITIDYTENTITISLEPSAKARGVFDFQRMAYLANNHLLVALLSVFPVREACLTLGALLVFSSLLIGLIRYKQFDKSKKKKDKSGYYTPSNVADYADWPPDHVRFDVCLPTGIGMQYGTYRCDVKID